MTEYPMTDLLVVVVSWKRPDMLRRTLRSLKTAIGDLTASVRVFLNEADTECTLEACAYPEFAVFSETKNIGINGALQAALTQDQNSRGTLLPSPLETHKYVLISDHDILYREPLEPLLWQLEQPRVGAIALQDSPENPAMDVYFGKNPQGWVFKYIERCGCLLMKSERFAQLMPLPVGKFVDFDWWVMRDAPHSINNRGQIVACKPGAAIHLGYKLGNSTWQTQWATPEYEEYRRLADEELAKP